MSVYQYDKVVLQLEYCQQKLSRQKEEIRRLLEANQRMRLTLNEAAPENINPVRFLLHAARHLRASNKRSSAIPLLFKMAKDIQAIQGPPYRTGAPGQAKAYDFS